MNTGCIYKEKDRIMMNTLRASWIVSIILIFLSSCEKEEKIIIDNDNYLIGSWIGSGYEDNLRIMTRADKLKENNYGFTFFSDGKFIERKNAGWCGTPPISYADYEGAWIQTADSLVDIKVGYWGSVTSYKIGIVSLDVTTLKFVYRYDN